MAFTQDKLNILGCNGSPSVQQIVCRSPEDDTYNCLAWAAGLNDIWWWPEREKEQAGIVEWPIESQSRKLPEVMEAYSQPPYNFAPCDDDVLEIGVEKIALYFDSAGNILHAAWQRENGLWSSKTGEWEDVDHHVALLEGKLYGSVKKFMMRPRQRFEVDFPPPPPDC